MKKILIAPFSKPLNAKQQNAKNYPYWQKLVELLKQKYILTQIVFGNEPKLDVNFHIFNPNLLELEVLLKNNHTWLSVDTYLQHIANFVEKTGIVIWGQSDPLIFGHKENLNLLKDRKYLRENQYGLWRDCEFKEEVFMQPEVVYNEIIKFLGDTNE
jgi:ADP-heptose:LPS heptosyltransferase